MIQEFRGKIIKAAQDLQQQLADNAEKPALDGSNTDSADVQNDTGADEDLVLLARLKERQRKRATETDTQDQRRVAKPKSAKRQSKRTACSASGNFETPSSRRKDARLTEESFAASVQETSELVDPGAASSGSAARQRCRRVLKLQQELIHLNIEWGLKQFDFDEAATEIQVLIKRAKRLTKPVLTWSEAQGKSMKELYKPRCGFPRQNSIPGCPYQDCAEMTAQASAELDARIHDFVMPRDEINEKTRGLYPCLWEIKTDGTTQC